MSSNEPGPGCQRVLKDLRSRYPESSFLALGQTVFWDEPVKAVLRQKLDELGDNAQMLVGVHDTDYFAKTRIRRAGPGRFALLAHNDGTTRDLWSAAGEVSTLFGSETVPYRHDFMRFGVPFDKLARAQGESRQIFLDEVTEAWGWRGLIYTGSRDLIVSRLPLKEVGSGILQMLAWAFENAVKQIGPDCCCNEAQRVADTITAWCREYCIEHPDQYLTDLFQHVLPRLYTLLLNREPSGLLVDGTSNLLRFTPETASLKRFEFVSHFINPATRDIAVEAYNAAVNGSTIYTLDKFGAGALPFDLIVPGKGRGTLRVTPRVVFVETPQPIAIGIKQPVKSIQELAEVLHRKLGDQITLVGKAVTLVSMLAQEFIFVFNEEGSTYVTRTRQMNDTMRSAGIALDMRPILRMQYETWDALSVAQSTLRLPDHLASTFGRKTITAPEFAASWRTVVEEQKQFCAMSASLKKPRKLLEYLQERDPVGNWDASLLEYNRARAALCDIRNDALIIHSQIQAQYRQLESLRSTRIALERQSGEHFRSVSEWTQADLQVRERLQSAISEADQHARQLRNAVIALKARVRAIERGPEVVALRHTLEQIERAAEMARLRLLRDALLTMEGLSHTNHRPSAWWLPMVDKTGEWFRRICDTTHLYTEPLQT